MKKNFIYGVSALLVASVMMMQVPTQAATKEVKKPPHQRVIKHQKKGMTGGAANVTDKKTETKTTVKTTKPMPTKKY